MRTELYSVCNTCHSLEAHDVAMYGFRAPGLTRCLSERQGAARGRSLKNAGILTLLLSPNFPYTHLRVLSNSWPLFSIIVKPLLFLMTSGLKSI